MEDHAWDRMIEDPCCVTDQSGQLLVVYLPNVLSASIIVSALIHDRCYRTESQSDRY